MTKLIYGDVHTIELTDTTPSFPSIRELPTLNYKFCINKPSVVLLSYLHVPFLRGQGKGSKLINLLLERLIGTGVTTIRLLPVAFNTTHSCLHLISWYESKGFVLLLEDDYMEMEINS